MRYKFWPCKWFDKKRSGFNEERAKKKSDYKKEYKRDYPSLKAKLDCASRNKVRRQALKKGKVKKGDGKDVHHIDGNPERLEKPGNLFA